MYKPAYQQTITTKLIRRKHVVRLRFGMTAKDAYDAFGQVPGNAKLSDCDFDDDNARIYEFIEEIPDTP